VNNLNLEVNDRIEVISQEKAYKALILDIDEEFITVNLPVCNGEYLILDKGEVIVINSSVDEGGCYSFFCKIISRGKEGNIIYYKMSKPFNVTKIQRRNSFRVELIKEVEYKIITGAKENDIDGIAYKNGLMVDLSAGGAKLKIKETMKLEDLVLLNLKLNSIECEIKCEIVRIDNTPDKEILCGLKFIDILPVQTEKIIKELFEIIRRRRANL
jgi:c-di-GMP-binding flagellar brake protein YcgR